MSLREKSPLLHSNNNGNLQRYDNDMTVSLDKQSISKSSKSFNGSNNSSQSNDQQQEECIINENINDLKYDNDDGWCAKCWGNLFQWMGKKGITNKLKTGFSVIIINAVPVSLDNFCINSKI